MRGQQPETAKSLEWVASSRKDFMEFPDDVQDAAGYDLWLVQKGGLPSSAKVMRGFGGAEVMELVEDYDSDTYRVVHTVRFSRAVYVLHAFQKKSRQGIATPKHDVDVVKSRLRIAAQDYAQRYPDEA